MGTEGESFRVIAGRYRLEARVGRGGMGVVWRATDQLLERRVAVKELTQDTSLATDEARLRRDRSLREARAVAQLHHPHIIVVHDVVEDDERPYIVMELIEGSSLADQISRHGPVDADEAARIGIALLGALGTAHAAGVLHRDVKPANVLLEDGTDRIVLTDFGIAQVAGATTLTESGSFVGSPEYTAPERMSGVRTGPESDLWSLGALLCTALSGESPFRRDSLGGILHAVVIDEVRPPAQAAPLLPVVRGLLERDPERRLDAAEAERMLRAFRATGRTPKLSAGYTPGGPQTQRREESGGRESTPTVSLRKASSRTPDRPPRPSGRAVLIAAVLVAALAGAGVSAAALLMRSGDGGGDSPRNTASATATPTVSGASQVSPGTTGAVPGTSTRSPGTTGASPSTSTVSPGVGATAGATPSAATAPSGYRLARDPRGFSLAVPDGFTRTEQKERVFYLSPGEVFRLGIKVVDPQPGGPLAVMERADADGASTNPGYRDGRVSETVHARHAAALWEFTWDGFSAAEGPRHTYDLCWEEGGRMYDVWVSAPVGKVREAKEYFDVALDTFATSG
ncbi:protein kinase domain-containing protein [Streptomyces sp. WI04-05B]|uniref:serine/threonine-protein kinase n=1 Tax=Streptomyces TaxID=1883 RepID=UPI00299FBF31|nr:MULTISPECIES: protein kinase [unclassified Streptomyces]MDX2543911.1 protein kinase [Streptomyces sp. WI04-05B]MDX2584379.1 protein kinase [Streptomyces sp. WI04-05A]